MNPAIQNMVISLGAMQLARKIPFEDPQVLNYVRIAYVVAQLIMLGAYYFASYKIKQKNDLTVLKYVEPPSPMSGDKEGKLITTTVRDYDLAETSKLLRGVFTGVAMMGFLHGYLKYTQPLFIQALMGVKGLYDAKPLQIHLLGKKAEGDLKRPWKAAPSMFGGLGGEPQTDNASVTKAEKRVGAKEE